MIGAAVVWVGAMVFPASSADTFTVTDCAISGEQIAGTKIVFPENRDGTWLVEIDRDGRTLTSDGRATGYAFARDGEPYRGYHAGVLVLEGVGNGDDCGETTTTAEVTTTTGSETTTTLAACDDVECPPQDTTTTTVASATTTTIPGAPNRHGECPPGQHLDPAGVCFADAEGG